MLDLIRTSRTPIRVYYILSESVINNVFWNVYKLHRLLNSKGEELTDVDVKECGPQKLIVMQTDLGPTYTEHNLINVILLLLLIPFCCICNWPSGC
jgi:hypothetical protein